MFRQRRLPIFFTAVVYRNQGQAGVFRRRIDALNLLQPGSHWVKIDERLAPHDDEPVIEKRWGQRFLRHPTWRNGLAASKADSLIVTGLTTSGCVRATAVDGLQHDYPVVVPREAVGGPQPGRPTKPTCLTWTPSTPMSSPCRKH